MGLDLIAEGCAKAGHEAEWRKLVEQGFNDEPLDDEQRERFAEISIPPYEQVAAPRVGQDPAANAWIIETRKAVTREEQAAVLKEFDGYYALQLVTSDGLPKYTHGTISPDLDETSFRGAFLGHCEAVLDRRLRDDAWEHKWPEAAVAYGKALLAAADKAETAGPQTEPPKRGLLSALGFGRKKEVIPFEDQLDIVRAAGRWYVFWGERGHPIRAWS